MPEMSREEIKRRVYGIITDRLNISEDKINPEASFLDDLGADSLELTELVLAVEEEFDIKIPDEEIEQLTTVDRVLNYVQSRLRSQGA